MKSSTTKERGRVKYSQPFGAVNTAQGNRIRGRPGRSKQEKAKKANELLSIIGQMRAE